MVSSLVMNTKGTVPFVYDGEGVPQDREKAEFWRQKAKNNGCKYIDVETVELPM